MKTLLGILAALLVMALGYWAYSENYATQAAIKEAGKLRRELASQRRYLQILQDEWAYLNRPDRLKELADLNFERLQLLPMNPDRFGIPDQVAYPPVEEPVVLPAPVPGTPVIEASL